MHFEIGERHLVSQMAAKLPSDDPVHAAVTSVLKGQLTLVQILPLREALTRPSARLAPGPILAAWALGLLEIEESEREQVISDLVGVLKNGVPMASPSSAFLLATGKRVRSLIALLFTPTPRPGIVYAPGPAGTTIPSKMLSDARTAAALSLGRLGGRQAVEALTRAAVGKDASMGRAARFALTLALPLLSAGNEDGLDRSVERELCSLLQFTDEHLSLCIIEAMGYVGGAQAWEAIQQMPAFARTEEIERQIAEVEPAITQRIEQERMKAQLLRPTDATTAAPDQLLRPAEADAAAKKDHLLRPHNGDFPR